MVRIVTKYVEGGDIKEEDFRKYYHAQVQLYLGNDKVFLTEDGKKWTDFGDMYGHAELASDNFTRTFIENYSDEQTQNYVGGLSIFGYLNNTNVTKEQPYSTESITFFFSFLLQP
ncbi:hypothetical protein K469DRAFT_683001 [Zopfia rhizophila CBS 207.26]|uniref:Uncharacterized protein n=1 Tax=Zopfia rhizophila CBS 207.26 TaxID=1314779 RepID=A0A6A6ECX9_9PEZI|nr:hypothetical protein K469DRAFT_683001 [Zopfia rhizophila CBS 207.26]